eukprot:TRINITY_DN22354_c0_g1_i1.p1 TRINITY_DN22354_c0_g1~~TRINITY_DN22354_c0_g1_i1.p1  ORF type:complete len:1033 (-),score=239.44 TRINITY_DN22354_c0_g1_i1:11-3109(-)
MPCADGLAQTDPITMASADMASSNHASLGGTPASDVPERRARSVSARMRHSQEELLQRLGEKKREKEEKLRQQEERQRRRQALLRNRLLQKPVESRIAAEIGTSAKLEKGQPPLPPRLPAPGNFLFPGSLQPCQADVQLARPLPSAGYPPAPRGGGSGVRRVRSWHDHRSAQASLDKRRTQLEPLPRQRTFACRPELGGTGEASPAGSPQRAGAQADDDGEDQTLASSAPMEAPPDINLHATVVQRPADVSSVMPATTAASRYPCSDMAMWKKRNGHPADAKVFCCSGGYYDFRDALLARGWVENPDKESPFFDLQWGMASDINHENLQQHQIVNHFCRNREITTKVGLTLNLRNSKYYSDVDIDAFYPRAFNLYDSLDRADFVLDFKLTHVESILRGFLEHIDGGQSVTFSREVLEIAIGILQRSLMDLDEIIDQPKLAEKAFSVTNLEWSVLQRVSLDDASCRLAPSTTAKALEAAIQKQGSRKLSMKRRDPTATAADVASAKPKRKKSRARKAKKLNPAEVPLSASCSEFDDAQGIQLVQEVRGMLEELARRNPQFAINGTRNAWIIKPAGKSRGRGIKMMRKLDEIFKATECDEFQWICQKYIEQPQTPCGYKFDIRQWVLVTDWNPLTVYVWQQPYIRFAGEKYDSSLEDNNQYMHLVNNSIVKYMDGFNQVNEDLGTAGCMWFRQQYEHWLHAHYCKRKDGEHCVPFLAPPPYTCETFGVKQEECCYTAKAESDDEDGNGDENAAPAEAPARKHRYEPPEPNPLDARRRSEASKKAKAAASHEGASSSNCCENPWNTCVFPQIKDIILWSLRTVMETVENRKNSFELFGYDFMLSEAEEPKVWLIEVNSSPAMDYSTHVTTPLVKKVLEDTAKLLVDRRLDPSADIGEWELLLHDGQSQAVQRPPVLTGKLDVLGKASELHRRGKGKKAKKKIQKPAPQEETGHNLPGSAAACEADLQEAKGSDAEEESDHVSEEREASEEDDNLANDNSDKPDSDNDNDDDDDDGDADEVSNADRHGGGDADQPD